MGSQDAAKIISDALQPDRPKPHYDAATLAPMLRGNPSVEEVQRLLDKGWTPPPHLFKDTT